jgi:hypothetical protein
MKSVADKRICLDSLTQRFCIDSSEKNNIDAIRAVGDD